MSGSGGRSELSRNRVCYTSGQRGRMWTVTSSKNSSQQAPAFLRCTIPCTLIKGLDALSLADEYLLILIKLFKSLRYNPKNKMLLGTLCTVVKLIPYNESSCIIYSHPRTSLLLFEDVLLSHGIKQEINLSVFPLRQSYLQLSKNRISQDLHFHFPADSFHFFNQGCLYGSAVKEKELQISTRQFNTSQHFFFHCTS